MRRRRTRPTRRAPRRDKLAGDFNEWTRGLASRLLAANFESADLRAHMQRTRTYPWALPVVHLDHIYYDPTLELTRLALDKSRTALVASDHLPLVAELPPAWLTPRAQLQTAIKTCSDGAAPCLNEAAPCFSDPAACFTDPAARKIAIRGAKPILRRAKSS